MQLSSLRPSLDHKLAGATLFVGAALLLVGGGAALGTHTAAPDPCAMPAGLTLAELEPAMRTHVAHRLLACADLRFGRITLDEYRTRSNAVPRSAPPAITWASSVRGFSSQYSPTSWSAAQALGAPDVYPAHGDHAKAWASQSADASDEWIELGFTGTGAVSAVELYETFNPGVDRVELVTASGRAIVADLPPVMAPGASAHRVAPVACTDEPVIAVRVHVASSAVAGWNEIDAVGLRGCSPVDSTQIAR
jgi:hypothetical protein